MKKYEAQRVYDLLMGNLIEEDDRIKNAFTQGELCDQLYCRIYAANERLCKRLGVAEDRNVEEIIDCFFEMNRELCLKMFLYGAEDS